MLRLSYPLSPFAFEEIKAAENMKIQVLEKKHDQDVKAMREEMNRQFAKIMSIIQQNPQLAYIKPEVLRQKTKKE